MDDEQVPAPHDEVDRKRGWEPPLIEELDFGATEAAFIPGVPVDFGIYTV